MQAPAQPWKTDWWRPREQSLWLMGRRRPGVSIAEALGVLIAGWGGQLLASMVASGPDPLPLDVGPNARALLFTFGISLPTGLLFGIAPALRLTGGALVPAQPHITAPAARKWNPSAGLAAYRNAPACPNPRA
jgi:hypothetical protein